MIYDIINHESWRYKLKRSGAQGLIRQLVYEEVLKFEGFLVADGGVAAVRIDMRLK